MPKETIGRKPVRKTIEPTPFPQNTKIKTWKLKRLSQLMSQDPSLWGLAWALLWRIMVLLLAFRTIILIIRKILYILANVSQ
jgi:hypothetical protein